METPSLLTNTSRGPAAPPATACLQVIEAVEPHEAPQVAAFIERVIGASVDGSEDEKKAILVHIHAKLGFWLQHPEAIVHLKVRADEALVGVVMVRAFWNLCHLFVAPEFQGQGVGRALVTAAVAACQGKSPRQYLQLNSTRNAAGFYERLGFVLVPDAPPPLTGIQYEIKLCE